MSIYIENDNDIVIDGFRKANPFTYKQDAEFEFTLTLDGTPVTGADDIAMPYQAGTDAQYIGVLLGTVSLTEDEEYVLTIVDTNLYATKYKVVRPEVARVRTN